MLGQPLKRRTVDILNGESRTAEFLKLNPNGRVPVLELADGRTLSESNAIIEYIAYDTELIPASPYDQARMRQWMYFEQYQVEPTIAVARFWRKYLHDGTDRSERLAELQQKAAQALDVMNGHLADHQWFVGDHVTLADIALYGYTHVAADAHIDLARWPHVARWVEAVAARPGHIRIDA